MSLRLLLPVALCLAVQAPLSSSSSLGYTSTSAGFVAPRSCAKECVPGVEGVLGRSPETESLVDSKARLLEMCTTACDFSCTGSTCGLEARSSGRPLAHLTKLIQSRCAAGACGERGAAREAVEALVQRRAGGAATANMTAAAVRDAAGGCDEGCRRFVLAGNQTYFDTEDYEAGRPSLDNTQLCTQMCDAAARTRYGAAADPAPSGDLASPPLDQAAPGMSFGATRFAKLKPAAWQAACKAGCYFWSEAEEAALRRRFRTLHAQQCRGYCATAARKVATASGDAMPQVQFFKEACELGCPRPQLEQLLLGTGRKAQGPPGLAARGGIPVGSEVAVLFDGAWVSATLVGFTARRGLIRINDGDERLYPWDSSSTKWCFLMQEPHAMPCAFGWFENGAWRDGPSHAAAKVAAAKVAAAAREKAAAGEGSESGSESEAGGSGSGSGSESEAGGNRSKPAGGSGQLQAAQR